MKNLYKKIQDFYMRQSKINRNSNRNLNAEVKYLKEKIHQLEFLLEEKTKCVDSAKSNFLKNLYHEIRTPLNSIVGFTNLVELNNSTEQEQQNYNSYIRASSEIFLRKMDEIIDASIIEAGLVKIVEEKCDIADVVRSLHLKYLSEENPTRRINFQLCIPENFNNTIILCDEFRIRKIIDGLLKNAFTYTTNGLIELGFSVVKNEIEFYVRDSGPGNLAGKEQIVFSSFSKVDDSDTSPDGLGLSLSMIKKLTKYMNGRVWYYSELSKGTTFYFSIPFKLPVASIIEFHSTNKRLNAFQVIPSRILKRAIL